MENVDALAHRVSYFFKGDRPAIRMWVISDAITRGVIVSKVWSYARIPHVLGSPPSSIRIYIWKSSFNVFNCAVQLVPSVIVALRIEENRIRNVAVISIDVAVRSCALPD